MDPNVFETANAGFAQAMYEEYLRDPTAVGPEWRRLFESGVVGDGGDGSRRGSGEEAAQVSRNAGTPGSGAPTDSSPAATTSPAPRVPASQPIKGPAAKLVANMTESLTVPTATTFRVVSVAMLDDRRRALNTALQAGGKSAKISFTHLIAYAIVQAAKEQPVMAQTLAVIDGVPHRVQPDGMGLGLSIARSIIESHGGRIWAENNRGSGATFHFTLRTAEDEVGLITKAIQVLA